MSRMTRIVPATVLTLAALALAAPVAQAKPLFAPSGGPNDVTPIVQQIQEQASGVVTTADTPLAHPVHLPQNTGVAHASTEAMSGGLARSSTVHVAIDKGPVAVPDSSGNGFDWSAAAIGAALGGTLMVLLTGIGFRRRGQLAA